MWISVDDRLPEYDEYGAGGVLVYHTRPELDFGMVDIACYGYVVRGKRRTEVWWMDAYGMRVEGVTHWMPIPDAPDGQKPLIDTIIKNEIAELMGGKTWVKQF